MTDTLLQTAGALVLGSLLLAAGYYIRGQQVPDRGLAPPDTDSVATAKPDTSGTVWLPDVVTVYDTVHTERLVRDTIVRPTDFQIAGCFQGEPLRRETRLFGPDTYTAIYFDPDARRFKQKSYEAGRPKWALWPEVEIRTTPWGQEGTLAAGLRWRDWTLTAGYTIGRERRGWAAGLRWRPFRLSW